MLHNNIYVTTILISCVITLSSSWNPLLSDIGGTSHNSTRIKRQIQTCTLPDHPPNGRYTVIGSQEIYTPNSFVNAYSSILLTCTKPYVAKSKIFQTLCIEGLWVPRLSTEKECVRPITTTTAATTTAAAEIQLILSEDFCVLPSHPRQGTFSVADSTGPYTPDAKAPQFASLRLTCLNSYVSQNSNPQSLCIAGAWSPPISTLGTCIQSAMPNPELGNSCLLPQHPSNGEFKIIGSEEKLYVPDTAAPEHSIMDLTCRSPHTTQNKLARALCNNGQWYPPVSELGACIRKDVLTTTQATTERDGCILPDHPTNGRFKILGTENYEYMPHSVTQQYTNIQLICTENGTENKVTFCLQGAWSPSIVELGECTTTTNTKGDCILPPHPPNGQFKVLGSQDYNYVPNSLIRESANIQLDCKNGSIPESDNPLAACDSGQWKPNLSKIGGCIRTCPSIESDTDSYRIRCRYKRNEISCIQPKEGTRAYVECKNFFEYTANRPIVKCKSGLWNYVITPCTPECGRKRVGVQTLIVGGGEVLKGEYPWLVGIYYSSNRTHLCGGSIISRYYVLSAAHCFTTTHGDPFDKNDYLVAAGKYYRDLDDARDDSNRQIVNIEQLYIPQDYKGMHQGYASDYAILRLQHPFVLTSAVQPVCVDWDNKYETTDLRDKNKGVVAGWGYTQEGIDPAKELKKLTVPFRSRSTCEEFMPKDFVAKYYTHDKFCAGFIDNKTSVCSGDSGGGLYFRNYDYRFFVRGIVSLAPPRGSGCDSNQFALYTKVSKHLEEIGDVTGREV